MVLPDGDVESRLASLDNALGSLVLQQVNLDDGGDVQVGGKAVVKLSSIGHITASAKIVYLRAGGPSGPVLLELHFESASVAQSWVEAMEDSKNGTTRSKSPSKVAASPTASLNKGSPCGGGRSLPSPRGRESSKGGAASSRGAGGGTTSPSSRGAGEGMPPEGASTATGEATEVAVRTLRELVRQQEEQARLLEEIGQRKGTKLLKQQERLEDALGMLEVSQGVYSKQQRFVQEQQKVIDSLQSQLLGADSIVAACNANACAAAAGLAAAKAARAATASAKSMSPTSSSQGASPNGRGFGARQNLAGHMNSAASRSVAAVNDSSDQEEDDDEGLVAEQQALVEKLRALEAEKGQFEAQLQKEQGSIFAELQELQGMMADLGIDLKDIMEPQAS